MTELAKLTWPRVQELVEQGCAAILPVGATEAHGPHLPLDTDVTIARGMARRAAETLEARGRACVVLPPVSYAVTEFAAAFPGSLSLPPEVARAHVEAVLSAAVTTGFAPVAVANGHLEPAHIASLQEAMAAVEAAHGVRIAFPDVTRRRNAQRLTEEFQSGACHAGSYESSLVMADDPRSVLDEVRRGLPSVPISLVDVIRAGKKDFLEAGGDQAYFGHPAEASAEEGQQSFDTLAALLVEALDEVAAGPRSEEES